LAEEVTRTLPFSLDRGDARAGMPALQIVSGAPSLLFPLVQATCLIGRTEAADLFLDADGVSRKHVKIVHSGGAVNLIDLGSTNGTYLNNKRIDVATLREGDRIQIGQVILRFEIRSPKEAPPAEEQSNSFVGPPLEEQLSARELEVAKLVAEGLTNADIGKRLKISPRTVATHLANAYERLGIHSRAALARYVAESRRRKKRG
jgi:DNA-binding CsgD family transcriptional regulator